MIRRSLYRDATDIRLPMMLIMMGSLRLKLAKFFLIPPVHRIMIKFLLAPLLILTNTRNTTMGFILARQGNELFNAQ